MALPACAVCVVSCQTSIHKVCVRQWPPTLYFSVYRQEPEFPFPSGLRWFPLGRLCALSLGLVVGTVRIQNPCLQPRSGQVHSQHFPECYTTPLSLPLSSPPKNTPVSFIVHEAMELTCLPCAHTYRKQQTKQPWEKICLFSDYILMALVK